MIKASATLQALIVSVIIAALLCSIIIYSRTSSMLLKNVMEEQRLIDQCEISLYQLLAKSPTQGASETFKEQVADNITIQSNQRPWGAYQLLSVTATGLMAAKSSIVIAGANPKQLNLPTLYLTDNGTPLFISGSGFITGKCFIPGGYPRFSYLENTSNSALNLDSAIWNESFPSIEYDLGAIGKYWAAYTAGAIETQDSLVMAEALNTSEMVNRERNKVYLIKSKEEIYLSECKFSGAIIIQSDSAIYVKENAKLNNVILIAPTVSIGKKTRGCFHIVSSQRVDIGSESHLQFPSSIVLVSNSSPNHLNIDFMAIVDGSILIYGSDKQSSAIISEGARINGYIYCETNIEVYGEITGSMFANWLVKRKDDSFYLNHLTRPKISGFKNNYMTLPILGPNLDSQIICKL